MINFCAKRNEKLENSSLHSLRHSGGFHSPPFSVIEKVEIDKNLQKRTKFFLCSTRRCVSFIFSPNVSGPESVLLVSHKKIKLSAENEAIMINKLWKSKILHLSMSFFWWKVQKLSHRNMITALKNNEKTDLQIYSQTFYFPTFRFRLKTFWFLELCSFN